MKITKLMRVLLISLSLLMVLPLFACNNGETTESTTTQSTVTEAPAEETSSVTGTEPVETTVPTETTDLVETTGKTETSTPAETTGKTETDTTVQTETTATTETSETTETTGNQEPPVVECQHTNVADVAEVAPTQKPNATASTKASVVKKLVCGNIAGKMSASNTQNTQ